MSDELKKCWKDSSHTWMADIPFCPYCNMSSSARVYGLNQAQEIERLTHIISSNNHKNLPPD
jgi:DNA-binding helix-hairpin-helix protein with protein kinase domain